MSKKTILSDREIFTKAADLLETHGLADGTRKDLNGSMCVLGALDMAIGNPATAYLIDIDPTYGRVLSRLAEILSLPAYPVQPHQVEAAWELAKWSNEAASNLTPEVVIMGLRQAANTVSH